MAKLSFKAPAHCTLLALGVSACLNLGFILLLITSPRNNSQGQYLAAKDSLSGHSMPKGHRLEVEEDRPDSSRHPTVSEWSRQFAALIAAPKTDHLAIADKLTEIGFSPALARSILKSIVMQKRDQERASAVLADGHPQYWKSANIPPHGPALQAVERSIVSELEEPNDHLTSALDRAMRESNQENRDSISWLQEEALQNPILSQAQVHEDPDLLNELHQSFQTAINTKP